MFKDKVYEEMDDISKMIEPYQYSVNEELAKFPDEIEVDANMLSGSMWGIISVRDVLRAKAKDLGLKELSYKAYNIALDFFEFKIVNELGEELEETKFNFRENVILDKIVMYKKKIAYEDSDIEKMVKEALCLELDAFGGYHYFSASRLNEVADLFNAHEAIKQRSIRKKLYKLRIHFNNLFESKKLDIRDVGLSTRLGKWIMVYVKDGNLAALNNITRLKIMTHQNKPIYSMEEKDIK